MKLHSPTFRKRGNNGEAVPQTVWQRERQRGPILPMNAQPGFWSWLRKQA